jgi:hypothetical protein
VGDVGDLSSTDTASRERETGSRALSRASRASVARMKQDMEKNGERMDSMEAMLHTIMEQLTTGKGEASAEGTSRDETERKERGTPVAAAMVREATRQDESVATTDVGTARESRDAPGEEMRPAARRHIDAESCSQRSAQSLFEYKQDQLKAAVKYKRGLAIQRKKVAMALPKKIERRRAGSPSSEESEGEPMEVTYNIIGEAAGAVMGKGRSTLRLIIERTGCTDVDVGGHRSDQYRPVIIKANRMATVVAVKKIVKRLVKAHKDEKKVHHQMMLIKHDDGWGAKMPDDPAEAREVERNRALRQGGMRGARAGASATADADMVSPRKEGRKEGVGDNVKTEGRPRTPASNIYTERRSIKRDETPPVPGMFNGTHNMPGERGMPFDPSIKRARDEREAREKEQANQNNATKSTRDGWQQTKEDVDAQTEARAKDASATTTCMTRWRGKKLNRSFG